MLVTFTTKAWADITMFGDIAVHFIKMMGHSGTIPGAILAEDVPAALSRLQAALNSAVEPIAPKAGDDDSGEPKIALGTRAYPLVELLHAAATQECDVMWRN